MIDATPAIDKLAKAHQMNGKRSATLPPYKRITRATAALIVLVLTATGCGIRIPSDPHGTLDRATDGMLRVGASVSGGLVAHRDGVLVGSEVELIEGFAESLPAEVAWTVGNEEMLVDGLESGALDVVIGGVTDQTPWADRAGVTRGYPGIAGSGGRSLVFLVPLGENRLLSTLEAYLDAEVGG